ncbi:MAG: metallophosphoesterase [[Clostridium] fimetarium]|nr:metallophosphoesterase [Alistipes timonensis]MCM1405231.1 metallophosphoesterase [[Clostridium] fimetarium]
MRVSLVLLLTLLVFNGLVDWYIYRQLQRRASRWLARVQKWTALALCVLLLAAIITPARSGSSDELVFKMWLLFSYFSIYIPKYVAVLFDFIGGLPRLWHKGRVPGMAWAGTIIGVIVFLCFWWGALINRYNIDTKEVDVEITGLPESFDGYRVAQFSDMHVGTFGSDTAFVSEIVDHINSLRPDAIVFTGDIVNRQSDEIEPFIPVLSRLSAPDGVYAILGNHDYGDYREWDSPEAKIANMEALYDAYRRAGIKLLLNETVWLRRGNDSIALIGVENIGDKPFPVYGSLAKAYPALGDSVTKILLTHNPAHWTDSIRDDNGANVALSLAGHTHAMQFELFGVSPAAMRYDTWGGMYADPEGKRKLYVNIGAGEVGVPMRVGANPEITLHTLRR